jgi:hypothetical protein
MTRYVELQRQAHPDKSVLVSCQDSDERLVNKYVGEEAMLTVTARPGGITYTCYVFDSGKFRNRGDGGFIDWCEQDDNHAIFHGLPGLLSIPVPNMR